MMLEKNDDFSLSNYDQRDILSNLSSEICLDTINQQINKLFDEDDLITNSSDVFETFISQYKFLNEKYKDNEDFIPELTQIVEEILTKIINKIEGKFDFKVTFSESLTMDDKIHYIHMIYNFLINNMEDNVESLLYNYFVKNIETFPKQDVNTKDQAYVNLKSIVDSKYLNQLYFYNENLETIKEYKMYAEDLIEMMIENDPMKECNFWCTKIFIDNDFVDIAYGEKFISTIIELAFNSSKIYKVQNLLIKKYVK